MFDNKNNFYPIGKDTGTNTCWSKNFKFDSIQQFPTDQNIQFPTDQNKNKQYPPPPDSIKNVNVESI